MLAVPQIQGSGEDIRKVQDDLHLRIYPAALFFFSGLFSKLHEARTPRLFWGEPGDLCTGLAFMGLRVSKALGQGSMVQGFRSRCSLGTGKAEPKPLRL